MENEIELLNKVEAMLLDFLQKYTGKQYAHLRHCIRRVRVVRETLKNLKSFVLDESEKV